MAIQILIADDHGVLRAGLRALLNAEPGLEVVGEAADGYEVVRLAKALQPDVVLMDIGMPNLGGIEAAQRLIELQPDIRILMLTVHADKALLQEAIRIGAAGYILKRAVESELVNAIHAVARGDLYVHSTLTRALLSNSLAAQPSARQPAFEALTPREVEVLRLIATGYTNRQIAAKLIVSVRTVESHRANLMDKLNLHSRVELVRFAAKHGLLDLES